MIQGMYQKTSEASKFWNPVMETMSRDQLDSLQLQRIQGLIKYAYEHSPAYHELYLGAGLESGDIKTWEDYYRVPYTDKQFLQEAQATMAPFGSPSGTPSAVSEEYYVLLCQTSGTTGQPLREAFGDLDLLGWANSFVGGYWEWGVRSKDRFYFPTNWAMAPAFWAQFEAARHLGCLCISGAGVDNATRIKQIMELKPTVMFTTPSHYLHMVEVAKEQGVNLASSALKILVAGSEPGASIESTRRAIEEAWDATVYEVLGGSDAGVLGTACVDERSNAHWREDMGHVIYVDPDGNPVPDGELGEIVTTSFLYKTYPVIKYRSHDLARGYRHGGTCTCGRSYGYVKGGLAGRSDQMIIVKGMNVFPSAIEALIGQIEELSENYEIHVLREKETDAIHIKVEAKTDVSYDRYADIKSKAEDVLHRELNARMEVEVLPPRSLPRYEFKAKRFFDHRKSS